MIDILIDASKDTAKLIPFLFVTYLIMEIIEHKTSDKVKHTIEKSGRIGPFFGAAFGVFPQCGFSAAASSLYAGRVITVGTLLAVYLSTSDEMLPIFISEQIPFATTAKILGLKFLIGMIAGFVVDFVIRRLHKDKSFEHRIEHFCEQEQCNCHEDNILKASIVHTLKITVFIFIVSFFLGFVIEFVGEEALTGFITNKPIIGEIVAGLIGLIPNCAASVVITQLYLEGALSFGAMMSGLLVGAGIGIAILVRTNRDQKENTKIIVILYGIGVLSGIIIELLGITV